MAATRSAMMHRPRVPKAGDFRIDRPHHQDMDFG